MSCDEIVDIAMSYNNVHKYKGKYLTVLNNDDIIDKLIEVKSLNDDYQIFTYDINNQEQEFVSAIVDFVNDTFDDEDKIQYIYSYIYQTLKLGIYGNKTLDALVYEENLSKNEQKKIDEFCKKYKNMIAIWNLNGYTFNEKGIVKKEKIGRNDPCPCGSGKKYKKCCGR